MEKVRVLVIIPAYNEEASIEKVIAELREQAPECDYVVVNDCSRDRTGEILKAGGYNHIDLPVNLGIGGNVQTGFKFAVQQGYDVAVQLDGDGQHDPRYIKELVAPVAAGQTDMCIGSRFIEREGFQTSFMRRLGINILKWLIFISSGVRVADTTSGFRAMSAPLTAYFCEHYAQDYPEPEAIIAAVKGGFRVCERPVVMRERQGGVSSISAFKSAYYMFKVSLAIFLYNLSFIGRDKKRGN